MRPSIRFFVLPIILLGILFTAHGQSGNYPCLNVQNFGVEVNGADDCSGGLQLAIHSAAVTGRCIYLQAGVYRTSHTVYLISV
jgi:hypothetical protein